MGRTGPGDRCGVLLIRTLHLVFERGEARSLCHTHRKKEGRTSMIRSGISKGLVRVPGLLPAPASEVIE